MFHFLMKKWFGFKRCNETKTPTQVLKLAQELYDYIDENEESQGQDTNPQNPAGNQKGDDNTTESNSGNSGDEKGDESQDSEGSSEDAKEGDSDDQGVLETTRKTTRRKENHRVLVVLMTKIRKVKKKNWRLLMVKKVVNLRVTLGTLLQIIPMHKTLKSF